MLAKVTITDVDNLETAYLCRAISDSNVCSDRAVIDVGTVKGKMTLLSKVTIAFAIDDHDYAGNYVDHCMKYILHDIICRYRSLTKIDKDPVAPFTRTCQLELLDLEPIHYTVEYRSEYDKEYLTDDILEELRNEEE